MRRQTTRRELLRGGVAAGAGLAGGGGVAAALSGAAAAVPVPALSPAQALIHAFQTEQLVVISYQRAIGSGVLSATVRRQLRTHLGQELEHVALLERALTAAGQSIPAAPSLSEAEAALSRHEVHWSLAHLRSQHDCLKLLVDVESLVENTYFVAVATIPDPALMVACAEIMGCEAQHWTILSGLLNHRDATKAVPYPFVEGTP